MTIETELIAIKGNAELLTAEDVVEWAQAHPASELYKQFEWNNGKAAREYRLWQARRVIALHITMGDGQRRLISLSIDRSRDGGGYRDVSDVLRDRGLYEIMLADALAELQRLQSRYAEVKALKPVWSAAEKVRRRRSQKGGEKRVAAG